jgi:hypothetical protein
MKGIDHSRIARIVCGRVSKNASDAVLEGTFVKALARA